MARLDGLGQSPLANQFRLVLHTAAYWLMLALRDAVPRSMPLAWSEFATIRRSLLKIGARVVEKAARIRIHFASACLFCSAPNRAETVFHETGEQNGGAVRLLPNAD